MRLTTRQKQEIEGLEFYANFKATDTEIADYITSTVHGHTATNDKFSENRLRNTKTRLTLMLSFWKEDMEKGLLAHWELRDDPALAHPYIQRLIASLLPIKNPSPNTLAYCNALMLG